MAADNKSLGRFDLVGIPAAPRGVPQIEVTFDIDANGIVSVSAKDLGTGKEQKITVSGSGNLAKSDIERMQKEAESHAEDDKKKLEEIEIINQADTLVYTTEKTMKDMEGKVDENKLKPLKVGIEELKKLLEPEQKDVAAIKQKLEEITKFAQEAATELYQKAAASAQGAQGTHAGHAGAADHDNDDGDESEAPRGKKEKVVDADFTVDGDKKKGKR